MALFTAKRHSWIFGSSIEYSDMRLYPIAEYNLHANNSNPKGICSTTAAGTTYYVLNGVNGEVYKYNSGWVYQSVATPGISDATGIDWHWGDNTFYVIRNFDGKVYRYDSGWNYEADFTIGTGFYGLAWDGTYFWTCHTATNTVKKFNVSWVLQDSFDVITSPSSIDWTGTYFRIGSDADGKIYTYDSDFNLKTDYYDITSSVSDNNGIHWLSGSNYYIIDDNDNKAKLFIFGPNLETIDGHTAIILYRKMRAVLAPINQIAGNFEFYLRAINAAVDVGILLKDGSGNSCIDVKIDADKIIGDGSDAIDPALDHTWYLLRIDFDCTPNTYDLYVGGVLELNGQAFGVNDDGTGIDYLEILVANDQLGYIDGIGHDWDPDYD
ncbi:hypothetical protein LCGC14_2554960, partial [marine sediment metagenome]